MSVPATCFAVWICMSTILIPYASSQGNGAVRLVRNGVTSISYNSGIVQVYYNGQWGNICASSYFDIDAATVVCHQLGYAKADSYSTSLYDEFGTDHNATVLTSVICLSSYLTILQCSISDHIYSTSCLDDYEDATVTCSSTRIWANPYPGQVRLTGSSYVTEGLVEMYCNGQWGTICDEYFNSNAAAAVCNQLGYNSYVSYDNEIYEGDSSQPIWLIDNSCTNTSNCLSTCALCPWFEVTYCTHYQDVDIKCQHQEHNSKRVSTIDDCVIQDRSAYGPGNGAVRLYRNGVGSTSYTSGIVQVYHNRQWGNICADYYFGSDEADVICHQLGYTGASNYSSSGYESYGMDYNSNVLSGVDCSSSSYLTIFQCSYNTYFDKYCSDDVTDVTVVCYSTRIWDNPFTGMVRLNGSTQVTSGVVEVYCNGEWGTICDDGFTGNTAATICEQLGYNDFVDYDTETYVGSYDLPIWLKYASCYENNSCLSSCGSCPSSGVTSCSHYEDVDIFCQYNPAIVGVTAVLNHCDTPTTDINIGLIVGVSIVVFVVAVIVAVSIPICICLCCGVGVRSRNRGQFTTPMPYSQLPSQSSPEARAGNPVHSAGYPAAYTIKYPGQSSTIPTKTPEIESQAGTYPVQPSTTPSTHPEMEAQPGTGWQPGTGSQPGTASQPVMESKPKNEPPPSYSNQFPEEFPLHNFPPQTN